MYKLKDRTSVLILLAQGVNRKYNYQCDQQEAVVSLVASIWKLSIPLIDDFYKRLAAITDISSTVFISLIRLSEENIFAWRILLYE